MWTDELKTAYHLKQIDDGIFYIKIEDYIQYFSNTQICKHVQGYNYSEAKFTYDSSHIHNFFKIEIKEVGKAFFIVNQKNSRLYSAIREKPFENKMCSIYLFQKEDEGWCMNTDIIEQRKEKNKYSKKEDRYTYLGSKCGRSNRLHIETNVENPGVYILCVSFPVENENYLQPSGEKLTLDRNKLFKQETIKISETNPPSFNIGVYTKQKSLKIESYPYPHNSTNILRYSLFKHAFEHNQKINFLEEDEKDSWRSCYLPSNKSAIGFLVYENRSSGYIYELLTLTKCLNVNLISIIDQAKNVITSGLDDNYFLDSEIEVLKEDYLQTKGELESRISMLNKVDKSKGISEHDELRIQLTIGPKSNAVIIFEKYEETAGLDFKSHICFSYPLKEIIINYLFLPRRNKLKYNGKPCDVVESIYEHTTGVVFKYQNKSTNYRAAAFINFSSLDNLEVRHIHSIDSNNRIIDDKAYQGERDAFNSGSNLVEQEITDKKRQAIIEVLPGQGKILEVAAVNRYKMYSYQCEFNYYISMCGSVTIDSEEKAK